MPQSNAPAAVRRQIKEANRMQAAVQAGQDPFVGAPPPAASPAPPPGTPIQPVPEFVVVGDDIPPGFVPVDLTRGDPRVAQVRAANASTNPSTPRAQWAPASQQGNPPPSPRQQPVAAVPPPGAQPVADVDQRYKVLQGKYNSETRRQASQIDELLAQNRQLMNMMNQRQAAPSAPVATPIPQTTRERAIAAGFTEKEIEEYGEELVGIMIRTANNIAAPQLAQLKSDNARLASAVQNTVQTVTRSASDRFWEDLGELVSNYAEVNASQEWLDWLQQPDYISGGTRNSGLQNAFNAHDARRVAGIMKTFLAENERAPSTAESYIDPATLIAPGQPGASTPAPAGDDGDNEIWTEDQVRSFYADVRRGRIKGEQKAFVEARINRALVEGRIKPDHNDAHLINSR